MLTLGPVTVDLATGVVERPDGVVTLGERERELLRALAENRGRIVPRADLLRRVWGVEDPLNRALDVALGRLRKKLELDARHPRWLLSIHGEGIRLEAAPDGGGEAVVAEAPLPAGAAARAGLFGREREEALVGRWAAGPGRWLTLVGPGGVGKTRLLRAAAEWLGPRLGGARWVDLSSVEDPGAILPTLAEALGLELRRNPDPAVQIARAVAETPMLWALDNLEHLVDGLDPLVRLAERCPGVRVLASSRVPVEHIGETTLRVGGLAADAALALFTARAGQRTFTTAEREEILRIHAAVDGLPLALELAAAALPRQSLGTIRSGLAALSDPARPARHRSLRASFDGSWALLDPDARGVLARLSVFRAPVSEEAAEQVADAAPVLVDRLVAASLARRTALDVELHPLIRELAAERLAELDPRGETHVRLRRWALSWLRRAEAPLHGPAPAGLLRQIARRDIDLRAAIGSAGPEDAEALLDAGPALERVLKHGRHGYLWERTLAALADRLRRRGVGEVADALDTLRGPVLVEYGETPEIAALVARDTRPLPEPFRALRALTRIRAYLHLARRDDALAAIEQEEARLGPDGPASRRAELARRRCDVLWQGGRREEAHAAGQAAVALARSARDALVEAEATASLAMAYQEARDHRAAAETWALALALYEGLEQDAGVARCANGLAIVHNARRDLAEAERWARRAIALLRPGSHVRYHASYNLGNILRRQERWDEARACLEEVTRTAVEQDFAYLQRDAWDALANLAFARGDAARALDAGARALEAAERVGNRHATARVRANRAEHLLAAGHVAEALALAREAITGTEGIPFLQAHARCAAADALVRLGRVGEALPELRHAGAWAAREQSLALLHGVLARAAWALALLGRGEEARAAFVAAKPDVDTAHIVAAARAALGEGAAAAGPGTSRDPDAPADPYAAWAAVVGALQT